MGSEEKERLRRLNTLFGDDEIVEWFKALKSCFAIGAVLNLKKKRSMFHQLLFYLCLLNVGFVLTWLALFLSVCMIKEYIIFDPPPITDVQGVH